MFVRRHFDREVIFLCVRWYLRYKLSLRDNHKSARKQSMQLRCDSDSRFVSRRRALALGQALSVFF